MRKSIFLAAVFATAFSQQASAGLWNDLKRNIAGLGFDVTVDTPVEPSGLDVIPQPYPAPMPADPGLAYNQWLEPRLPRGVPLYNRPCTFGDGVRTHVVRCPVGVRTSAPLAVIPAPAAAIAPAPFVEEPVYHPPRHHRRVWRRHHRHHAYR